MSPATIASVSVHDVRFPTSDSLGGSDAMNPAPDYSAPYVEMRTNRDGLAGFGFTFTIGRGSEIVTVPVCPHAGGVGLCELVQHLSMFDYIAVSASLEGRWIEYVDHLHEMFVTPVQVRNGAYKLPVAPGFSSEMSREAVAAYSYPDGAVWRARS